MLHKLPNEFNKRVTSAVVIAIIFYIAIFYSPILFNIILLIMLCFMGGEWYYINKNSKADLLWGLVLISTAITSLYFMHKILPSLLVFAYFVVIWATDTMAMVGGKMLGGPRLAPIISPKKTWSGLLTGVIGAVVAIIMMEYWLDIDNNIQILVKHCNVKLLAAVIAVVSQLSDLLVSIFKRKHRVKDSGKIIPGHGGMLDRFDSIILSSPLVLGLLLLY